MKVCSTALTALCLACIAHAAGAQDLEPGVQTSSAAAPTTSAPAASSSVAPSSPSTKMGTSNATPAAPGARPAAAAPVAAGAAPKAGKASDRIELDTTQISGNRELPKVMYVVPWRKADPGEFTGRPLNSLLDEALTPVDRDVFRRQNRYYAALQGDPGSAKSQPATAVDGSASPTPKDEK
jgi:hypothetical protein